MEGNLGWTWTKILIADLAAILTILGFISAWLKHKQDKLEARFVRNEDKINDLSVTCARREEITSVVNTLITPVNHQLTEIRMRIDELVAAQLGKH